MQARGVVGHPVEEHPQPALMCGVEQPVKARQVTEERIYGTVVADVIAVVAHGRGEDGTQPDRVHAEVSDVVESLVHAGQIADAVAVSVGESPRVDLVDDAALPPRRRHAHTLASRAGRFAPGMGPEEKIPLLTPCVTRSSFSSSRDIYVAFQVLGHGGEGSAPCPWASLLTLAPTSSALSPSRSDILTSTPSASPNVDPTVCTTAGLPPVMRLLSTSSSAARSRRPLPG